MKQSKTQYLYLICCKIIRLVVRYIKSYCIDKKIWLYLKKQSQKRRKHLLLVSAPRVKENKQHFLKQNRIKIMTYNILQYFNIMTTVMECMCCSVCVCEGGFWSFLMDYICFGASAQLLSTKYTYLYSCIHSQTIHICLTWC